MGVLLATCTLFANDTDHLVKESMLYSADRLAKDYSGKSTQWQHPYARPNAKTPLEKAPNWISIYPYSLITEDDVSVLEFLGSDDLWNALQELGIQAINTGPMKKAGGLEGSVSIDGGFDRTAYQIAPVFGTYPEYLKMVRRAEKNEGMIIGNLIPGHTGLGADFHLALKNYQDYPGLYHMVSIEEKDWKNLPKVEGNNLSINLSMGDVEFLRTKSYISGPLEQVIFPEMKKTNWSITKKIKGADGVERRWVYLHYFKSGQPTLNWLDPSFAANRLVAGDVISSISILKNQMVRIDANAFLGIELSDNARKAWSEGHPLSLTASDQIAQLIRKLGGFSFQEVNLGYLAIKAYLENGADLSYDFSSRSALINAFIYQNTDLLRINYNLMGQYRLQPVHLVHALQNADGINYTQNQLRDLPDSTFSYQGCSLNGFDLSRKVELEDKKALSLGNYNIQSESGPYGTTASFIAAALGIKDITRLTKGQIKAIKKAHLLFAFFNAMQPGAFSISGWDLVGALPLSEKETKQIDSKDMRWSARGAINLLYQSLKKKNQFEVPRTRSLYGSLLKQLKCPNSFASQLKKILKVRITSNIATGKLIEVLPSSHEGVLLLLHELPGTKFLELTALNFQDEPISESVLIPGTEETGAINLMERRAESKDFHSNILRLKLDGCSGKAILFEPRTSRS